MLYLLRSFSRLKLFCIFDILDRAAAADILLSCKPRFAFGLFRVELFKFLTDFEPSSYDFTVKPLVELADDAELTALLILNLVIVLG